MILGQRLIAVLVCFAAAISIAACAEQGEMYTDGSQETTTQVHVTGCFQDMPGFDNFVLSNVGDAPSVDPAATRSFRIEQRGDFDQYVGKRVTINGSVASEHAAGMRAGKASSGGVDFNDLPELHVESVTEVSDNCGQNK